MNPLFFHCNPLHAPLEYGKAMKALLRVVLTLAFFFFNYILYLLKHQISP
jgi:hypothetical protein